TLIKMNVFFIMFDLIVKVIFETNICGKSNPVNHENGGWEVGWVAWRMMLKGICQIAFLGRGITIQLRY
ncbi:MAG: hypothetical protein KDE26_10945, partial [Bacteroidetes bacterium]|nr:hypothetical protein [Bacteroidota bacterium]